MCVSPTMGTAFFLADVCFIAEVNFERYKTNETVPISTVINTDIVENLT